MTRRVWVTAVARPARGRAVAVRTAGASPEARLSRPDPPSGD